MKNKRYKGMLYAVMVGYAVFVIPAVLLIMLFAEVFLDSREKVEQIHNKIQTKQ